MVVTKIAGLLFACGLALGSCMEMAQAQTLPVSPIPNPSGLHGTPNAKEASIVGTVRERPKRFRLYLEDILAANLSFDLNPDERRGLIVSPSIGVLYVFPQVGLNARTPGPRYVTFGATQNLFISPLILQVSYGQQWRTSFFEVGLLTFDPAGVKRVDYDGPKIVPRLVLGTRF